MFTARFVDPTGAKWTWASAASASWRNTTASTTRVSIEDNQSTILMDSIIYYDFVYFSPHIGTYNGRQKLSAKSCLKTVVRRWPKHSINTSLTQKANKNLVFNHIGSTTDRWNSIFAPSKIPFVTSNQIFFFIIISPPHAENRSVSIRRGTLQR